MGDARRLMTPPGVPVFELMSEAEALANLTSRRPDSDTAGDQFRLYEVPGRGHLTPRMSEFQALSRVPMSLLGINPPGLPGFNDFPVSPTNSWPTHVLTGQALENLHRWRTEGTPPPRCTPIEVQAAKPATTAVDELGNALGGLRHVFVEVPIASYVSSTGAGNPLARGPLTPWYGSSLGVDELAARYGSFEGYLREFTTSIEVMVRESWLNPVDVPECLEWAVRQKSLFERS